MRPTTGAYLSSADPLEEEDDMDRRYRTYKLSNVTADFTTHTVLHTRPREMRARCHKRVGTR